MNERRAWWVLIVSLIGVVYPFWAWEALYAHRPGGDSLRSPWFHDFVARALSSGALPATLDDFGWPAPDRWNQRFASIVEAVLFTPLHMVADFPDWWRWTQALALLGNGVAVALLARAVGARTHGLVLAGLLGAWCQPAWKELLQGRTQAALVGPALAALAMWLTCFGPGPRRLRWVAAAVAGGLAAGIYPPHLLLLAPLALPLVIARWPHGSRGPLLTLGLAALVAVPGLWVVLGSRGEKVAYEPGCPAVGYFVAPADLLRLAAPGGLEPTTWVPVGLLAVAVAALSDRRAWGVVGVAGLWTALSIGPCPTGVDLVPGLSRLGMYLNDFGRFTMLAWLVVAAMAGAAVERGPRWALLLGLAGAAQVGWSVETEGTSAGRWWRLEVPATATWVRTHPGTGAIAELPWDDGAQYASVLYAPERPRVNPAVLLEGPPTGRPFVDWLRALGFGRVGRAPTSAEARASGVDVVFYDPARCQTGARPGACGPAVRAALDAVLGTGTRLDGGTVWMWTVGGSAP